MTASPDDKALLRIAAGAVRVFLKITVKKTTAPGGAVIGRVGECGDDQK
jgi:hypothetical protein